MLLGPVLRVALEQAGGEWRFGNFGSLNPILLPEVGHLRSETRCGRSGRAGNLRGSYTILFPKFLHFSGKIIVRHEISL